jgi:PAS domain S-box-containing protein
MDLRSNSWQRHAGAIAVVAAAGALRLWPLHALEARLAWLTFYPAVVLAALYGGFSAGLLGTILSCLSVLFLLPALADRPFIRDSADWLGMAVFFATCVMISGVAEAMLRANARAKQARAKLEEAQLELGRRAAESVLGVMEAAPDGIAVVTADGVIELANAQMAKVFGYELGELAGQRVEVLIPEKSRASHGAHRASYGASPRVRPMGMGLELTGLRKDGTEFAIEISLSPLDSGPRPRIVAAVRDITWRRWAEDELKHRLESLQRSNAELEQFAYVSSHDLQEPLRMVSAYTQLLADRYGDRLDADAKEFIGYAVDGAKRMQQLIADLLEFSRVRTRGDSLQPVALGDVVASVCRDLETSIGEAGAVVTRDDLPTVCGDAAQLGRLFQNLIGNAVKFHGEEPPRVHIGAELGQSEWIISVRDNGIGIAPQHRERVFVIFQRLHSRTEFPGTGIGLAIAKRIVERHGGRIWVEPATPRGSIFRFTLLVEPGR